MILLSFASPSEIPSAPRRLANIRFAPSTAVQVVDKSGSRRTERLAVLECHSDDYELQDYFFRVVLAVLDAGGEIGDEREFETTLDGIITLFCAIQRPARGSIQGLWAELALVVWCHDPSAAIASWHSDPHALHDFTAGADHLEVKSTAKKLREHHFSLDQLSSVVSGSTLFASLVLVESTTGTSVNDLVGMLHGRGLSRDQLLRVEAIVAETLGTDWRDAGEVRYALESARESLRILPPSLIPTIPMPIPAELKAVRFVADVSNVPPLPVAEARCVSRFFAKVLPSA